MTEISTSVESILLVCGSSLFSLKKFKEKNRKRRFFHFFIEEKKDGI